MDDDPVKTTPALTLSPAAVAALYKGNKIEGIRIVREERNVGLKDAKDAVEQYLVSQPSLQSTLDAAQSESKRRLLLWLVASTVAAVVLYFWLLAP
jgi:hypothetical protein